MFYYNNLHRKRRDYYRFLWNDQPSDAPKIYRFKGITMGSVDSPFLVINTVHYHLDQIIKTNPKLKQATEFIKRYVYVDDLIGASDSIEQVTKL